jgi:hypothetical protein
MIGTPFSNSFSILAISLFASALHSPNVTCTNIIFQDYIYPFQISIYLKFQQTHFTPNAFFSFLVHISDRQNAFTDYVLFFCLVFPRVSNTIYCAWLRLAKVSQFFAHSFTPKFVKKTVSLTAAFFNQYFFMIRFKFWSFCISAASMYENLFFLTRIFFRRPSFFTFASSNIVLSKSLMSRLTM